MSDSNTMPTTTGVLHIVNDGLPQKRTKREERAMVEGRFMDSSFNAKLGEFHDPDEAKDIEEMVSGHDSYEDLPPARQQELRTAVTAMLAKLKVGMKEQEMQAVYKKATLLKGGTARKSELIAAYRQLVRDGAVAESPAAEEILIKKKGKSHSGVLVITVFFGPGQFSCPKDCHYCPNQPGVARSYLLREPGVLRGFRNGWDPIRQFYDRAQALESNGHVVDKIEIIILGGTFSFYPKDYVEEFMTATFYAANTYYATPPIRKMGTLEEEIKLNETARCRIIGVTAETRPDFITNAELRRFRTLGITRVQLGIQHLDDRVLDIINRDCPTAKTVLAIKRLLDAGFKVDAHWMPDLPGSSYQMDKEMFEFLLSSENENFQVDQWKVYPTATVPFTKIKEWYEQGTYKPYAELDGGKWMVELILMILEKCPYKIRLNRIIRDIPSDYILAGEKRVNLRQLLDGETKKRNIVCKDIRERECKGAPINKDEAQMFVDEFRASEGTEFYISIENKARTVLYGHLRLRIRDDSGAENSIFPALRDAALIRELHTYGKLVSVSHTNTGKEAQHVGVGSQLMAKAEEIAASKGFKRAAVIAGVGVRLYYAKLGYTLEDTYMVKLLGATQAAVAVSADAPSTPSPEGGGGAVLGKLGALFGFGGAASS